MSDVPVQLVVAAFQDEKRADEALSELKAAKWAGLIGIQDAAVLRRDQNNKLHVKDTGDWGGAKGGATGAIIGGAIGAILGPGALVVGAIGAVIGGLAAKWRDSGFDDARLKKLGENLTPGTSALVAIIEHKWVADLEKELAEAGADMFTEELAAGIGEQLSEGKEVSFTAVADQESFVVEVATGEPEQE